MSNKHFFSSNGKISLEDIISITGVTVRQTGDIDTSEKLFSDVSPLENAGKSDISFLDNTKYLHEFANSEAGACFVREKFANKAPNKMVLLISDNPYYSYALTVQKLYQNKTKKNTISEKAVIAKTATIGKNVNMDSGVVIGENVKIGDNCKIGANSVISDSVHIGSNSDIGALCSISHAIIGENVIIHRGVHIGQDGFGFAAGQKGIIKVPQIGIVKIGDHVEIGSGTCIDRGSGHDTEIGYGSKIDNLVQIAHNVKIGSYTMIAAQTGIAGSTHIGNGVLIGGQVGFSGHNNIGDGAKIAAKSGVKGDIPAKATYGGAPAVPIIEWHRQTATINKLSKKNQ
ncbi:MAG: UDP-3-O-(3-hydroxymyristoyl)glucosamine N-acyltransferase [Rickettsiales bacterium]